MLLLLIISVIPFMIVASGEILAFENATQTSDIRSRTLPFNCQTATFARVTLHDFIYKHGCIKGWDAFFNIVNVKNELQKISNFLQSLVNQVPSKVLLPRPKKIKKKKQLLNKVIKKKKPQKQMKRPQKKIKQMLKVSINPELADVFRAFNVLPANIKVVILGQDPTPQPGKATGLAFSVSGDARKVPSVFNLLLELKLEGIDTDLINGDLSGWVNQGVFLLNKALTIPQGGNAGAHLTLWNTFTGYLLDYVSKLPSSRAWILWGNEAIASANKFVKGPNNYKVEGSHPSSMGGSYTYFLGGNYFTCANNFLKKKKIKEVNWNVPRIGSIMKNCPT